jgi:hypothetical protein
MGEVIFLFRVFVRGVPQRHLDVFFGIIYMFGYNGTQVVVV